MSFSKIDRQSLVQTFNPIVRSFDPLGPMSVGNGEFAFTADLTGLQTFYDEYLPGIPLCTLSQWGWHSTPRPADLPKFKYTFFDAHGRQVPYAVTRTGQEQTFNYLRENPHRLHLGRIGFRLHLSSGTLARPSDLANIRQELDLFTGDIRSEFTVENHSVQVRTAAHPQRDAIAAEVAGPLLENNLISVEFEYPFASSAMSAADWTRPQAHQTELIDSGPGWAVFWRKLDATEYFVNLRFSAGRLQREAEHHWSLAPNANSKNFWFCCEFCQHRSTTPLAAPELFTASKQYWNNFWNSGAALDLRESKDSRAHELQRRIILSQYLTAIQCAGSLPPQETGLTCNSWYGKFHLEMHYWHAAHFASWKRVALLERSLDYYNRILPSARQRARSQGYDGARWPKMTDPAGADSPSPVGPFLIWEQPHPIHYAELCYQAHPNRETLEKFAEVVQQSAEFMASYAAWEPAKDRYSLGPPVIPAQENHPAKETWNPTFELSYWRYGLKVAQNWRQRLGRPRVELWDRIIAKLAPLPTGGGVYLADENCPQTFTECNRDHPSMLYSLGVLPGDDVDPAVMRRTLQKVVDVWEWKDTWGWDYGACAMTASRLGEDELAMDLLLRPTPKNRYLINGHNYQRNNLRCYLPGNGSLLLATAELARRWSNGGGPASWTIRAEGF